jgi:hypothetical protein
MCGVTASPHSASPSLSVVRLLSSRLLMATDDVPQSAELLVSAEEVRVCWPISSPGCSTMCQVTEDSEVEERWLDLSFTWSSKPYSLRIAESDRYDAASFISSPSHSVQGVRLESTTTSSYACSARTAEDPGLCEGETSA